jgi:CrcB protein
MIWIFIALGGALGAMSRYGLTQLIPIAANGFPWAIWCANVVGSMLMGLFYVLIIEKAVIAQHWTPLIMVGFLGALTTFSSFALDGVLLWQNGHAGVALTYIISSVVACLLSAGITVIVLQRIV